MDSFRNKNSIYIYYLQNKNRLENEIDNLPIDAKHRERKLEDMTKRLDSLDIIIIMFGVGDIVHWALSLIDEKIFLRRKCKARIKILNCCNWI